MKPFVLIISALLFVFLSTSCMKEKTPQSEEYVIKVDSIQVTDNVRVGSQIEVDFFGMIGPNGCSSFSRYIIKSNGKLHNVTLIGKRKVGENLICTENLPMLDGMSLSLPADSIGVYTVEIVNPGINNLINKKITIIP